MARPASFHVAHCSRPGCPLCALERRGERRVLPVLAGVVGLVSLAVLLGGVAALWVYLWEVAK